MKRRGEFKSSLSDPKCGKILLRSSASCLNNIGNEFRKWVVEVWLDGRFIEFVTAC